MCRPDLQAPNLLGQPRSSDILDAKIATARKKIHSAEAMPRIKEVERANSVDDLTTSRSFLGEKTKISTELKKIIQNSNMKNANLEEQ